MSQKKTETRDAGDEILDRAATQIRDSEPDAAVVAAAANRVWENLAGKHNARRGMKIVREDDPMLNLDDDHVVSLDSRRPNRVRMWALAAILVAAFGITQLVVRQLWPAGPSASVQTVDAQLFRVTDMAQVPMKAGDTIQEGDVIRTSRDGGAVIRLNDGSLVELAPRAEMSIAEGRKGTTLDLEHGNIIVEAAKQRNRHLYVATDDCVVSVVGTIFSVNHGTKGSRVSVIEGEVNVDHNGSLDVLLPGQQVTTHALLAPMAVSEEIAWSHNVDSYLEMLRQLKDLRQELDLALDHNLRYESELLDLMPENTVFYAATPNVADTMTRTHQVFQQRLAESPELAEWWGGKTAGAFQEQMEEIVTMLSEFGSYLGEELAVGGYVANGDIEGILALAEVDDVAGLENFVAEQLAEIMASHSQKVEQGLVFVDDPRQVTEQGDSLYIWFHDGGHAVVSNSADTLRAAGLLLLDGGANPFVGSAFHQSISSLYHEGAEYLLAADLQRLIEMGEQEGNENHNARLAHLGISNLRHLLLEQKTQESTSHHRAVVTFEEARDGIASWLAEPSAMGGLEFVSPDAKLAAGIVFKDPAAMLDDILSIPGASLEGLAAAEERYGISLREDFAAALGGEIVFAVDGPLLPTPSWKVIMEVYDPARIQFAMEQAIVAINEHLVSEGNGENLELEATQISGRTFYSMDTRPVSIHYTFAEGYMLIGSSVALLDEALRFEESGYSISQSQELAELLPQDGRNNFSALVYQDFSDVMQAVAEKLSDGNLTDEQQQQLDALKTEAKPMLGYAYADTQRITLAAGSDGDFLTSVMLRGFGLKNPAGMEALFSDLFEKRNDT